MAILGCYSPDFRIASTVGATGATSQLFRRKVCDLVNTGGTFVADGIDTGRYCIENALPSAAENIGWTLSGGAGGGLALRGRFTVLTTTGVRLWRLGASTAGESVLLNVSAAGALQYSFNNGSAFTTFTAGPTIAANQTFRLDAFVDFTTGTTHTLRVTLWYAGVKYQWTVTGGTSIVTATQVSVGVNFASASSTFRYSDVYWYDALGDYDTNSDHRVYSLNPTGDGTHSFTDNDFQTQASANYLHTEASSYQQIDDAPGAVPDLATTAIKQVVARPAGYMEHTYAGLPGTNNVLFVRLLAQVYPVGSALANQLGLRLDDGGTIVPADAGDGSGRPNDAVFDASNAADTAEYACDGWATSPQSGAAWTVAQINALRTRIGYSNDVSPPPAWSCLQLHVLVGSLVTGTASSTSASGGSATGIASTLVSGTASSTSASGGSATGVASGHLTLGTAASTSPSSATAVGTGAHHAYQGSAASTSASAAAAVGTALPHQYNGSASSTSASGATAVGSSIIAARGRPWRPVAYPRFGIAESVSKSSAHATGKVSIGLRDQLDEDAAVMRLIGFVG